MLRTTLQQTHDSYDAELWADYDAIYAGGKKFFARIRRFLHQNEAEPATVYLKRLQEANYRCYAGGIVDYFASYLFGSELTVKAKRGKAAGAQAEVPADPFYAAFKEDCDGLDNDIHLFLRSRVAEAMTKKVSWWLVEMPTAPADIEAGPADSLAEWKKQGLDKGHIRGLSADQVLDWEVDDNGVLMWAIVLSVKVTRALPGDMRTTVVERYDVYDRETVQRFELVYEKSNPPAKNVNILPDGAPRAHGFSRVPLVNVDVGDALWLINRVASPQLEHFRLSCAQGWGIRRTCYAMPIFNVIDKEKPPVMGVGHYIMIGKDEKMEWSAPPATPFVAIGEAIKSEKDEIYRVVHQMAMGVDNNAAAVGRSAESKEIDSAAVRVVLDALGKIVREAVERTYSLLSEARGEDYEWSIDGLDDFSDANFDELVAAALGFETIPIASPTLKREWHKRLAAAALPDADQQTKDKITAEIEENTTDESVLHPVVPGEDEPDGDEPGTRRPGGGGGRPTAKKGANGRPAPAAS